MSNTFSDPPVLPTTSEVISGSEIASAPWGDAADALNRCAGRAGSINLVSQVFYSTGGLETAYHESASQSQITGRWRIPYASNKHTQLKVTFRAARLNAASSGAVTFFLFSPSVSISVSTSFSSTSLDTYAANLNIVGGTTDTNAELYFRLTNAYVTTVCAQWTAQVALLTSAYNIQGVDFVPHGANAQGTAQAVPARLPLQMRDNISALRGLPRVLMNWSATAQTTVGTGTNDKAPRYAGAGFTDLYAVYDYIFDGTQQGGHKAKIWIFASDTTTTASGVGKIRLFGEVISFGDGWNSYTVDLSAVEYSTGLTRALTLPTARIYVDREQGADLTEGLQDTTSAQKVSIGTGAQIKALSIWLI